MYDIRPNSVTSSYPRWRRRRRSPRDVSQEPISSDALLHVVSRVNLPLQEFAFDSVSDASNLLSSAYLQSLTQNIGSNPTPTQPRLGSPGWVPEREDRPVAPQVGDRPVREERFQESQESSVNLGFNPPSSGSQSQVPLRDEPRAAPGMNYGLQPLVGQDTQAPLRDEPRPAPGLNYGLQPPVGQNPPDLMTDEPRPGPWTSWGASSRTDSLSGGGDTGGFVRLVNDLVGGGAPRNNYPIEVLVMADFSLFKLWQDLGHDLNSTMEHLRQHYSLVLNGVDLIYNRIQNQDFSLSIRPKGIYVATTVEGADWSEQEVTSQGVGGEQQIRAVNVLRRLRDTLTTRAGLPSRDYTGAFTRHNMVGSYDQGILGMSTPRSICTEFGVSINRDSGPLVAAHSLAHQLAHSLGSEHDGSRILCPASLGYMMSPQPLGNTINMHRFSSCSVNEMRGFLTFLQGRPENCLTYNPFIGSDTPGVNQVPFGQMFGPHEQCRHQFGWASFYCSGRVSDRDICARMQCYNPVTRACVVSSDTRAAEGTTCGMKKWCSSGQCVESGRAPPAPESCTYGDYEGPLPSSSPGPSPSSPGPSTAPTPARSLTCRDLPTQEPWRCYSPEVQDRCCETCDSIRNSNQQGCEFGDRSSFCESMRPHQCYDNSTRATCCETCQLWRGSQPGCPWGDENDWCPRWVRSAMDCYRHADSCCATCARFTQSQNPECTYGDREIGCAAVAMNRHMCYDSHIQRACCQTCTPETANEECPFGDREPGCTVADCLVPDEYSRCCETCAGFVFPATTDSPAGSAGTPTGSVGTSTGSSRTMPSTTETSTAAPSTTSTTSSTTQSTATVSTSTASTQRTRRSTRGSTPSSTTASTSQPGPNTQDREARVQNLISECRITHEAPWCGSILSHHCYETHQLCCPTCSQYNVEDRLGWRCRFGDRELGCGPQDCLNPQRAQRCCATCAAMTSQQQRHGMVTSSSSSTTLPTTPATTEEACVDHIIGCKHTSCRTYFMRRLCCQSCSP